MYIERDTPLNFHQALVLLGISAGINAVTYNSVFMYNKNLDIEMYLCSSGATHWGIYVEDQMAAEGFAFLFGSTINPEIGRDIPTGYYHYHDGLHLFRIWFGVNY